MASRTARERLGLLAAVLSAATFATSGPFAKPLLATGWTPGALVLIRVGGAAVVLLVPTVLSMRGRWGGLGAAAPALLAYGALAVAGAQLCYFQAIERLTVGVALLLEYLGIVLVVLWVWATSRRAPGRLTVAGIVSSALGLALVLDVAGSSRLDPVGVLWGLGAAVGLAAYYVLAARESSLPPVALAGLGLSTGAVLLAALGLVGILPLAASARPVALAGGTLPPWAALTELALVGRGGGLPARDRRGPRPRVDRRLLRRAHRGAVRRPVRLGPAGRAPGAAAAARWTAHPGGGGRRPARRRPPAPGPGGAAPRSRRRAAARTRFPWPGGRRLESWGCLGEGRRTGQ